MSSHPTPERPAERPSSQPPVPPRTPKRAAALAAAIISISAVGTLANETPAAAATTIAWSTTATSLRGTSAAQTFVCPPVGVTGNVWGTDVYTDTSSICTAGTHAGLITATAGGPVTIQPGVGSSFFVGTSRSAITTRSWSGAVPGTFTVVGGTAVPGAIGWDREGSEFRGRAGSFTFVCPPVGVAHNVWGTDLYSDGSSICTAAVHAGAISQVAGGPVTFEPAVGAPWFVGTKRFGVSSRSWSSPVPGTFRIAGTTPLPGEITWDRDASELRGRDATFTFRCSPVGVAENVWGTDVYTDSSSICTAAYSK